MNKSLFFLLLTMVCFGGCFAKWQRGWNASEYFDDRDVVELCNAIQKDKVVVVKRLLDKGVDPNAKGDGQITPLAWALRHKSLGSFELLLKKGADPNVKLLRDVAHPFEKGSSVVHVVARAPFEYFELAFQHGGDPNLKGMKFDESPLLTVIKFSGTRKIDRIKLLLDVGADVEQIGKLGNTPLLAALSWSGQYDVALELLKLGADPMTYRVGDFQNSVHVALRDVRRAKQWTPVQAATHAELIEWLEKGGYPVEEAREDVARWASFGPTSPEGQKKRRENEMERARINAENHKKLIPPRDRIQP